LSPVANLEEGFLISSKILSAQMQSEHPGQRAYRGLNSRPAQKKRFLEPPPPFVA